MSQTKMLVGYKVALLDREGVIVWCKHCAEVRKLGNFNLNIPLPIFWEDIFPSSQDCHVCGCLMVKPGNSWFDDMYPNLFNQNPLVEQS